MNRVQLCFGVFSVLAFAVITVRSTAAEINSHAASQAGLVVAWEVNIGGAPLARGDRSFVLWPHSTAKNEFVTVRSGGKVLQRIHGDEVDQSAVEQAIYKGEKLTQTPRIGLEGAKGRADKLVATYKKIGKTLEVEPYSQRLIYIVTLASNGILEVIDAETGLVYWKTEFGDTRLEMFGPGVSDDYIVVTNGNHLYAFDLLNGGMINSRSLPFTPTGSPSIAGTKAVIPSIDGRLMAYDIVDPKKFPVVLRSGNENRLGVTHSIDRNFISWPTGSKLFIAKAEGPKLWTSISMSEAVSNTAAATPNGFVFSGREGTIVHCNVERNDSILWKTRLALPVSQSPIVNQDVVLIATDNGMLYGFDLQTGVEIWDKPISNINRLVGISKEHAYAINSSNQLVTIQLSNGQERFRTSSVVPNAIPNAKNDRLYFVTSQGQLTCLREPEAIYPTFVTSLTPSADDKPKEAKESTESTSSEASPFGEEAAASGESSAASNPFGTDPF
jgi:outer membrane protein assembly factor BamB